MHFTSACVRPWKNLNTAVSIDTLYIQMTYPEDKKKMHRFLTSLVAFRAHTRQHPQLHSSSLMIIATAALLCILVCIVNKYELNNVSTYFFFFLYCSLPTHRNGCSTIYGTHFNCFVLCCVRFGFCSTIPSFVCCLTLRFQFHLSILLVCTCFLVFCCNEMRCGTT